MNSPFSKLIAVTIIMTCFSILAPASSAQDQTKFILKLNDTLIGNMKSLGSLNSVVPSDAQGKIAIVEVKFESTDPLAEAETVGEVTEVLDDACMIDLTEALIESARSNPLRFEVPAGSKFSKVFLNHPIDDSSNDPPVPSTGSGDSEGSSNKSLMPLDPPSNNGSSMHSTGGMSSSAPSHFISLNGNRTLSGKMEITDKLVFTTKFGEVGIGVGQIKGIRFHVDGEDAAIIVLKNGDTITGIPKLDNVNVITEWGRAEVETKFIEAVVTTPNARFQPNSNPGGPGWILLN